MEKENKYLDMGTGIKGYMIKESLMEREGMTGMMAVIMKVIFKTDIEKEMGFFKRLMDVFIKVIYLLI